MKTLCRIAFAIGCYAPLCSSAQINPETGTGTVNGRFIGPGVMVDEDASEEHYEVTLPAASTGFFRLQINGN